MLLDASDSLLLIDLPDPTVKSGHYRQSNGIFVRTSCLMKTILQVPVVFEVDLHGFDIGRFACCTFFETLLNIIST
jgi:hypothetical protein